MAILVGNMTKQRQECLSYELVILCCDCSVVPLHTTVHFNSILLLRV